MPDLSVTDDQLSRLEDVREDLEGAFVADYGTVLPRDALEYLLDNYTPPAADASGEFGGTNGGDVGTDATNGSDVDGGGSDDAGGHDAGGDGEDSGAADAGGEVVGDGSGGESPSATLKQAMDLLDAHADRWREGSGDEPYEVDLPDGSTEGARTKDDVKRLLFKHWR